MPDQKARRQENFERRPFKFLFTQPRKVKARRVFVSHPKAQKIKANPGVSSIGDLKTNKTRNKDDNTIDNVDKTDHNNELSEVFFEVQQLRAQIKKEVQIAQKEAISARTVSFVRIVTFEYSQKKCSSNII